MAFTEAQLLSQVQQIRTAADVFCADTITLKRRLPDVVIDGESVTQYASPVTVRCRIIVRSGESRVTTSSQYRQPKYSYFDSTYRIQLPYGTGIKVGDRLEYTDSVKTYVLDVVFVPTQHDLMGAFIIGAEEIV